jgi:ATP-dependent DNA helicase RecG
VQYLKGVGPARAAALARLGIATVEDLLLHVPRRHEDRTRLVPLSDLPHGQESTVEATVAAVSEFRARRGLTVTKAALTDASGIGYAIWYNQSYLKQQLRRGMRALFFGRVERRHGEIRLNAPEFEVIEGGEEETWHTGRLVPVYPSTEGLSQRVFRNLVRGALTTHAGEAEDILPEELRRGHGFTDEGKALWALHFPETAEAQAAARRRLAFEELLVLQLGVLLRREQGRAAAKPQRYRAGGLAERFLSSLPFPLTGAQRRAIDEIVADLRVSQPMSRLLQGDVGSGKTVVAVAALLTCIQGGFQGALMAPTEILAEQHYLTLRPWLDALGVRATLLTGGRGGRERAQRREAVAAGEADLIVGTHALLEEAVAFARLGLVVVDEQHKFGVLQRARLRRKGFAPDVLVMTATPIPRTLALTLYGDLDVTTLDDAPPGRGPIATHWRAASARPKVYAFVREQIAAGRQAYVVCPLIEDSEKLAARAAAALAEELRATFFPDLAVALLHGRMGGAEKERTMAALRAGEIHVLVATSVIEVGIDVTNASVMVIEDADRFGLAQLHQLRGRVGRGAHRSYCILIASPATEEGRRRMEVMTATTDGFAIAQEDLRLRGPGEVLGTRQHGLPDLRVADLMTDLALLEETRAAAAEILRRDPALVGPGHRGLAVAVTRRFAGASLTLVS